VSKAAEAEKAAIIIENARKATKAERELHDYIAHEIRNPVAAAISACSFVSSSVNEAAPLVDAESRESVREDVGIIDCSLQFINDLLRNMLDMHRAASSQLNIALAPVDLCSDVLEPVASMLYRRGASFEVLIDCPENLVVSSDRLRLKQVILNLARNSVKFVEKGFIRLRAIDRGGNVCLYVEDSGPGIPLEKRSRLFVKFQDSLDSLNQGTGIGLALCRNLVELMSGVMYLDESYDSGVDGFPGCRFVVDLKTPPLCLDLITSSAVPEMTDISTNGSNGKSKCPSISNIDDVLVQELPQGLSILLVDDDFVLRKLFSRAVKRIAPDWHVQEAANG
jgi:signal transduction histidine kinase